jgi:uncharacterized protein (TIGR04551 family)
MRQRGLRLATAALSLLFAASEARATGFADHGQDLAGEPERTLELDGYFRARGTLFYNLDLDRGPTPSGQLLFPVPLSDPDGQTLAGADMRLRTDLAIYAPGGGMAVKLRVDWLDNVSMGGAPEGIPSATSTQRSGATAVSVKRAYGEALTPFGLLAVGRMGSHWGLGMLTNGGDCSDCDSGDAADRVAFVTPLVEHLWAVAYDFSATGPFVADRAARRAIDVEPRANVHTLTAAVMHWTEPEARVRRRRAGKASFDYGAYASHRWQDRDVPATFVPTAQPVPIDSRQVTARGYSATALDLWLRLVGPGYRVEAEGAYLTATVEQPSLIPGVELRDPATSRQLGAALESELGDPEQPFGGGFDAGYASGDSAPGFGAFPGVNQPAPQPGDLEGPQARPPHDTTVDNFRFHPDYRVDRILFREIIGTVTDAVYLRPHARLDLFRFASGRLTASLAAIASFAVNPESAPGQKRPLGIELDPTLAYASRDGFEVALEQATLFPLAGLDNPELGRSAEPAQLWRLRLTHGF